MPNACPDQYRNITPRRECQLRGQRLGTIERPGAVPQNSPKGNDRVELSDRRRERVFDLLTDRSHSMAELRRILSSPHWLDYAVETLVNQGCIRSTQRAAKSVYEVVRQ